MRHDPSPARRRLSAAALLATTALSAVGVSLALAAGGPAATTTAASNIASASATLNGKVAPNQNDTTYYFEYGTTTAYGTKTPTQGPIGGKGNKNASADVIGLTASTTYHFRLVATNAAGTSTGADATFTTLAPGANGNTSAVTAVAAPKDVTFSKPTTISGQLTGPNVAGVKVTLEQNPAPFTGQFQSTGVTGVTSATGAYSLAIAPALNTQYRVVAGEKRNTTTSAAVLVRVRLKVAFHLSDARPKAGQKVRFSGTVLPAHDGKTALIQRRTSTGKFRTIATTPLVTATPLNGVARSKFSTRLRIRKTGVFRVRVAPGDGDHLAGTSVKRKATVG